MPKQINTKLVKRFGYIDTASSPTPPTPPTPQEQVDWNQNDPTAVDYIKNRICYEEGSSSQVYEYELDTSDYPAYYNNTETVCGYLVSETIPWENYEDFDINYVKSITVGENTYTSFTLNNITSWSAEGGGTNRGHSIKYGGESGNDAVVIIYHDATEESTVSYYNYHDLHWDPVGGGWDTLTFKKRGIYFLANGVGTGALDTQYCKFEIGAAAVVHQIDSKFIPHDSTKQDKLTAGQNITITNNVISASGDSGLPVKYRGREFDVFQKVAFIGDSYTQGDYQYYDAEGEDHWPGTVVWNYSQAACCSRLHSGTYYNYGITGITSLGMWNAINGSLNPLNDPQTEATISGSWDNTNHIWNFSATTGVAPTITNVDCAIIQLGINDAYSHVTTAQYGTNITTIINRLRQTNPKMRVFLIGVHPSVALWDETYEDYNDVLNHIASNDSTGYTIYIPYSTESSMTGTEWVKYRVQGHLTALGTMKTVEEITNYISYYMANHPQDFKDIQFFDSNKQINS